MWIVIKEGIGKKEVEEWIYIVFKKIGVLDFKIENILGGLGSWFIINTRKEEKKKIKKEAVEIGESLFSFVLFAFSNFSLMPSKLYVIRIYQLFCYTSRKYLEVLLQFLL